MKISNTTPHFSRLARALSVAVILSAAGTSQAEIVLLKIGEPLWEPTGFVRSTLNAGSNSQADANVFRAMSNALGASHDSAFLFGDQTLLPGDQHDGPYETEISSSLGAAGLINTDTFLANEIVLPNVVMTNFMIVPTEEAPSGVSTDAPVGPIIPEEVLPIRDSWSASVNGSLLGRRTARPVDTLERLLSASDSNYPEEPEIAGLSHHPVNLWVARFSGEQVVGDWELTHAFRDATGNGWDLIDRFEVVRNATEVAGDFNYNGELDMGDYNTLRQNVEFAPSGELSRAFQRLDMNADDRVDDADTSHWVGLVPSPEAKSLTVGETYSQDFDSLSADGEAGSALPSAWTVTDKHGFPSRSETNVSFPATSSQIRRTGQNPPLAFSVGQSEERGLAMYRPRGAEESAVQLLANTDAQADALKIDFSVEAWDLIRSASASRDGGEAAFDVTVEIDTGDGTSDLSKILGGDFRQLLSLGMVTTGAVLPKPDGDLLDGNDPAHRVSFASDVLHADIPADSRLRFRWTTTDEAVASEGWLFGIDDVKITLASAGDTNLDGQFNSGDIVNVQQAGKFATDQSALWGEGDWNGDDRFDRADVIMALQSGSYGRGSLAALAESASGGNQAGRAFAAIAPDGATGDGQTSIVYDAGTGELSLDAPAGVELTSFNVDSAGGIFTGNVAQNLGGSFDNDADANIFKATFGSSFGSLSFGNVAQPGLSEEFVIGDLTVVGSLAGGGDLGNVDLVYVPEPTSVLLLSVGLAIGLVHFRRVNR